VAVTPSPYFDACCPKQGEALVLQSEKYKIHQKVDYIKEIHNSPIFKFAAIDSISDALRIVGYSVFSPEAETPEPGSTFEIEDAVDFIVKDIGGQVWGEVTQTQSFGPNEILELTGADGDVIYVPFSDGIIKEIDEENRWIIIDPPAGLKDLNKK
jgi:16S rRNA processing protein RimM